MNAILGFSEILLGRTEDPRTRTYLNSIHTSGKALLSLIDDILDLSKIEAGKMEITPEPVAVRFLLEEVAAMFTRKTEEKGLRLHVAVPEDLPPVFLLDEMRLRQILINLMGNAVKFTHKGAIRLCVHEHRRADDAASSPPDRLDIVFEVEDTGVGIPEDQQQSVFEPFRQQSAQNASVYTGTGLGLSITRSLARLMGGDISLESEVGIGTVFRVMLPQVAIAEERPSTEAACEIETAPFDFARSTVLLVDDAPVNRELIQGFLDGQNLTVVEAESGEQALRLLGVGHLHAPKTAPMPRPDLILMDIRMPGMDGYETTRHIKENDALKEVPIIAFTASAMKEEEERASAIFDGFIRKPAGASEVLEALRTRLPCRSDKTECAVAAGTDSPAPVPDIHGSRQDIIATIEKDLLPEWREIMDLFFIDDVAEFARKVDRMAAEYGIGPLSAYAGQLLHAVQQLDVEGMSHRMSEFKTVLENLQKDGRGAL